MPGAQKPCEQQPAGVSLLERVASLGVHQCLVTSCVSEAALRRPAGPTGGPLSSAPGPRRPRPSAAGPARLPAQRAQSAAHSAAHSCPPGAILEACDVGTARSPLTHI